MPPRAKVPLARRRCLQYWHPVDAATTRLSRADNYFVTLSRN